MERRKKKCRETADAVEKMLKKMLEKYMREIEKLREEGREERKCGKKKLKN